MQTIEILVSVLIAFQVLGFAVSFATLYWRDRFIDELRDAVQGEIRVVVSPGGDLAYIDFSLLDVRHLAHFQDRDAAARK